MAYLSELIIWFAFYSFAGWILETSYVSRREGKFVNRGFLNGFFVPIYGFGAILIIRSSSLISDFFNNQIEFLSLNILISIVLVTLLEFVTGYMLEKIFHSKWWDYSDRKGNIKGYICLEFSIIWGFLAFVLIKIFHPEVNSLVNGLSAEIGNLIATIMVIYFIADTVISVKDALDLRYIVLNHSKIPLNKYREKIVKYKRLFGAFPRLLILNAGIINRDVKTIITERVEKFKIQFKSRFL